MNNIRSLKKLIKLEDMYGVGLSLEDINRLLGNVDISLFLKQNREFVLQDNYIFIKPTVEKLIKTKKLFFISQKKLKYAKDLVKFLSWIPWIKFIAISGSVAFNTASENDDIDVFIVTKRNRLWLTRFCEWMVLSLKHVRRKPIHEKFPLQAKDLLCTNYYVSENLMDFANQKKDFLLATEIAFLRPIFGEEYLSKMISANQWIRKYFPKLIDEYADKDLSSLKTPIFIKMLSIPLDLFDSLFMIIQILYMIIRGHDTKSKVLSKNEARFFNKDFWLLRRSRFIKKIR
ncbi:hypothetical protein JW887_01965 [Candidatus Dojkabacteria bacterium]|nr:hypothetical protein [Candidatus Dojkabacteria bacterium]